MREQRDHDVNTDEGLPAIAVVILKPGEKVKLIQVPDPPELLTGDSNPQGKEFGLRAEVT